MNAFPLYLISSVGRFLAGLLFLSSLILIASVNSCSYQQHSTQFTHERAELSTGKL